MIADQGPLVSEIVGTENVNRAIGALSAVDSVVEFSGIIFGGKDADAFFCKHTAITMGASRPLISMYL